MLSRSGVIDPESIDDYLDTGGYEALRTVLGDNDREALIEMVVS